MPVIDVLPAIYSGGKADLVKLLAAKQVITFASQLYLKGHACTNFKKW